MERILPAPIGEAPGAVDSAINTRYPILLTDERGVIGMALEWMRGGEYRAVVIGIGYSAMQHQFDRRQRGALSALVLRPVTA
ncbi:hypothetical protein [Mycobacterium malmoense]|uniref:hypothetical protein n=1 Tax=Mycobacterium malmoense TaxID=1780 RepID=UPI0011479A11|nr:hypothetical protein [Mycobacterium malmoense]